MIGNIVVTCLQYPVDYTKYNNNTYYSTTTNLGEVKQEGRTGRLIKRKKKSTPRDCRLANKDKIIVYVVCFS